MPKSSDLDRVNEIESDLGRCVEENGDDTAWYGYTSPEDMRFLIGLVKGVAEWALERPEMDESITRGNPAMIGHFAGYQRARESVRQLLGIEDDA